MKRIALAVAVLLCTHAAPPAATAQATKLKGPLHVVVPYGPGGGMDGIMRPLAEPLAKALGVPVVIDNRPGGSTKIGTSLTANATPDGQTLIIMSPPGWIGYYYEGMFDFKPWETMTPIAQIAESPYSVIMVKAESDYRSWADLVAKAKRTQRPLMSSAPAAGGFAEMALHEIAEQSGIEAIQVPYASAAPARLALLSGEVDMQLESMSALGGIQNKQTRGVAVSTPRRLSQAPDIPTFDELGLRVNLPSNSFSMWGPAGIDPATVATLADALKQAIRDPAFVQSVQSQNLIEIGFKPGSEIRQTLADIDQEWGPKLAAAVKAKKKQ